MSYMIYKGSLRRDNASLEQRKGFREEIVEDLIMVYKDDHIYKEFIELDLQKYLL